MRFIPADGRNCCNNIFIAVHRCSSIFHPQTFGLFACFYYHKAGMNILKHMCRSISMPQSGVAGLGVHTSSTSIDSKLCPKWLQQSACLPAENQYSSSPKLLKVSVVSELNVCQWCSYKIWLSFSLLTNELDNFFVYSAFGQVTSQCFCLFFCWIFCWAWLIHRWLRECLYDIPFNTSHLSIPLTAACLVYFQPVIITNNAALNIVAQVSLGDKRCPLKWNGWVLVCAYSVSLKADDLLSQTAIPMDCPSTRGWSFPFILLHICQYLVLPMRQLQVHTVSWVCK